MENRQVCLHMFFSQITSIWCDFSNLLPYWKKIKHTKKTVNRHKDLRCFSVIVLSVLLSCLASLPNLLLLAMYPFRK